MKKTEQFVANLVGKTIKRVIYDFSELSIEFDDGSILVIDRQPMGDTLDIQFSQSAIQSLNRKAS